MLADVVKKLEDRLQALKGTYKVIRLDHAFSAFSGDIIGSICWEKQEQFLDDPEFAPEWYVQLYNLLQFNGIILIGTISFIRSFGRSRSLQGFLSWFGKSVLEPSSLYLEFLY